MPLQANLFLEPHIDFRPTDTVHPRPIDVQSFPGFLSKLFRNVPFLTSLEVSPFCFSFFFFSLSSAWPGA